jgi:hypothetical protein
MSTELVGKYYALYINQILEKRGLYHAIERLEIHTKLLSES